jgi:hypothetical protein
MFGTMAELSEQVVAMDLARLPWTYKPDIGVCVAEARAGEGLGAYVYALGQSQVADEDETLIVTKSTKERDARIAEVAHARETHATHFYQTVLLPLKRELEQRKKDGLGPSTSSRDPSIDEDDEDDEGRASGEFKADAETSFKLPKVAKAMQKVSRTAGAKEDNIAHLEGLGWVLKPSQRANGRVDKAWTGPKGERARSIPEALKMVGWPTS